MSYKKMSLFLVGAFFCTMALAGCGKKGEGSSQQKEINVSAAASLTESVTEIAKAFTEKTGVKVALNFGGSNTLATQIREGAKVDVFLSANQSHFDALKEEGFIEEGGKFTQNSLCLVAYAGSDRVQKVEDIGAPGVKLVFANDSVPVGKYAAQIIKNYGKKIGDDFEERVFANVVSKEENVRQVLSKVALGEGDAAFCYRTDVTDEVKDKVRILPLDEAMGVKGEYYGGWLTESREKEAAADFYAYLLSSDGQAVFAKYGFDEVMG